MHLAIIGFGQVGQALATTFRRTGHEVVFGVRDPATDDPAQRPVADAVAAADIAILAVPYSAALDLIRHPAFAGKTVIDATNPLAMGPDGLTLVAGHTTSGAEQIAAAGPKSRVVKAFNQTGFENMANPRRFAAEPLEADVEGVGAAFCDAFAQRIEQHAVDQHEGALAERREVSRQPVDLARALDVFVRSAECPCHAMLPYLSNVQVSEWCSRRRWSAPSR